MIFTIMVAASLAAYIAFGITHDDPAKVIGNAAAVLIGIGSFAIVVVRFYKVLRYSGSLEGLLHLLALIASAIAACFVLPQLIKAIGGH